MYSHRRKKQMIFFSLFKTLIGHKIVVELKNDMVIEGILVAADQFLNLKLGEINVVNQEKYPHMMSVKNCFIRGSVVRYVQLPRDQIQLKLLQDTARIEADRLKG
eukprot:TRINITY_DN4851_c0_g2_i1.p1 TRINITY_DN4851_c0_g2~~TRINITY_DN4851_c0_g2_i1.p1  ORF type:complete len:105 (-),score=19.24 TRINITY_DN4851_c0_g2_i1:46-360(-)